MARSITVLAGAAALAVCLLAVAGARAHAADRRALAELRVLVERPPRALAPPVDPGAAEVAAALAAVEARLARLEAGSARAAVAPEAVPVATSAAAESATRAPDVARRRELEALVSALVAADWDHDGLEDEMERFLALAREGDLLDAALADLEARVAASPGDTELRMRLADHYVAKLMTVSGPEQGLWGGRAEEQWLAVVELDDAHRDAHARLGTNYSFYPTVMGRTGDAIRHLERACELQRGRPPASGEVRTYLYLARLHAREGDRARARAVLEEGLERHPGDAELARALAELGD